MSGKLPSHQKIDITADQARTILSCLETIRRRRQEQNQGRPLEMPARRSPPIRLSDSRPQPIVFPGTFHMPLKEDDEEPQTELLNADNVVRTDDPVGDPVKQQDHGDCSLKESTPPRKRVKFDLEDKENYSSDGKIASEEEEDNCYVEVYYVDGEDYKPDAIDVKGEDYKPDANNEKICENNGMSVHTTCVAKAKSSTKVEDESLEDGELADETTEQTEVVEVQDLQ